MSAIADLLALIRKPSVAEPSQAAPSKSKASATVTAVDPPPPATAADLHEALHRLATERASAEQSILQAAQARDRLLLEVGTDEAIRDLDSAADAAHLLVERLDRLQPELLARLRALELDDRQAQWTQTVTAYFTAADTYAGLLGQAEHARARVYEIRREASRSFRTETDASFPYPIDFDRLSAAAVKSLLADIERGLRRSLGPPIRDTSFTVRFTEFTSVGIQQIGYQRGQEAGFDAATAWALVDAGQAEWVQTHLVPPRPGRPPPPPEDWEYRFGTGVTGVTE